MNPLYMADAYKMCHRKQYPDKTTLVYSNFTPRSAKWAKGNSNGVVVFGIQAFIKKYLIDYFNREFFMQPFPLIKESFIRRLTAFFGTEPETEHVEALHKLGYLPIIIKALPEGCICPVGVPILTITNTEPDFFWIPNFLETLLSTELWMPMTSATIAHEYKKILTKWADQTCDNEEHLPFQAHDFSMRGMSGLEAAQSNSAAHLLSFSGSDTIPSVDYLEWYYNADCEKELVAVSVPATEHSVASLGIAHEEIKLKKEGISNEEEIKSLAEQSVIKRLITKTHPDGFISLVSDTFNLWDVLTKCFPALKSKIMQRDGKVICRPDSGNPENIICGTLSVEVINDKYMQTIQDIEENFDDYLCDRLECGQGYYEDELKVVVKTGEIYYDVIAKAEIGSSKQDRGDKLYWVECLESIKITERLITPEDKGVIELLWDIFGGTINSKGYKILDPHIGAIYGDSITLERAEEICKRLEAKGFASSNIVLGIGSYSYQMNSRDTYGFAMKATYGEVDGIGREIFKDPITDDGIKKSAKGLLRVEKTENGFVLHDQQTWKQEKTGALQVVFKNGKIYNETSFAEIKTRLSN